MNTDAVFSGNARYRVLKEPNQSEPQIDFDEQYTGDYSIERRVLLTGVSKYDRPHLNVTKTLDDIVTETLPWGYGEPHLEGAVKTRKVATYTIRLENDGNEVLGPLYVQDIFPSGATFIEPSSLRPDEISATSANWTVQNLAIGGVFEIVLYLDVTKYYPYELVNRVDVCAAYNEESEWICARNFSALEMNWLTCCLDDKGVSVTKSAQIDPANPRLVNYRIEIANNDDVTRVATVTDWLPAGMDLMESSTSFASYDGDVIVWNVLDIGPYETKTIEFSALAPADGRFNNFVEVDPRSVDGPVVGPVRAACVIDVGIVEGDCGPTGCGIWQPPNWQFQHAGYDPDVMNCELLTCSSCDGTGACLAP
jgi:uncharacterized repeat protein (TIGR01451 family)